MPKYKAQMGPKIDNGKGAWQSNTVEIYDGDKKIGEYVRNYDGHSITTFCPFEQAGKWYALYSRDYTSTRVMSLPDCKDLGGESRFAGGFCPVEYYVPTKKDLSHWDCRKGFRKQLKERKDKNSEEILKDQEKAYGETLPKQLGTFGFMCGCVWGDDRSWKLEYLNLSEVSKGKIKREQRFGYWELPDGKSLKQCLNFEGYQPDGFTQISALKEESIPLLDRNWHGYDEGEVFQFNDDTIFNGMRFKIKTLDHDGCVCKIKKSANKVKEKEIFLPHHLLSSSSMKRVSKNPHPEWKHQSFKQLEKAKA